MKIAKVAITNVLIWVSAWTPYAVIAMTACFGNAAIVSNILGFSNEVNIMYFVFKVTPLVSQIAAFGAKIASCLNPIAFAINHPVYREVLSEKMPCLGIQDEKRTNASEMKTEADA